MKAIIRKAFAGYSTDDTGRTIGKPLGIAAFAGALYKLGEKLGGYYTVTAIDLVCFEDVMFITEGQFRGEVHGQFQRFTPVKMYRHTVYGGTYGKDKDVLFVTDGDLLKFIDANDRVTVEKVNVIADEENLYLLEDVEPVTMMPFKMTRELAIENAMSKLTDEEKKLLGLN